MIDILNTKVSVRWHDENGVPKYAFQIADGISRGKLQDLFETEADNRYYLVMVLDGPMLRKEIKEKVNDYPGVDSIHFVSVKEMRTSMETSLRKTIFGSAVGTSSKPISVKKPGTMRDSSVKSGLILTRIGKDAGYYTSNPEPDRYVWHTPDKKTKVMEIFIDNGFKFSIVKKLNTSDAKKRLYISTNLYGDYYSKAVDKLLKIFPDTMIEFMSVAEIQSTGELDKFLTKRIRLDEVVQEKVKKIDKTATNSVFGGW